MPLTPYDLRILHLASRDAVWLAGKEWGSKSLPPELESGARFSWDHPSGMQG